MSADAQHSALFAFSDLESLTHAVEEVVKFSLGRTIESLAYLPISVPTMSDPFGTGGYFGVIVLAVPEQ